MAVPVPIVRLNGKLFTATSCAIRVNGMFRLTDVESLSWADDLQTKVIPSNANGAPPLGTARGDYTCSASIGIYADAASQFETAVFGPVDIGIGGLRNLSEERFSLTVSMREDARTRGVLIAQCMIVGRPERRVSLDGKAMVKEYQLQPRLIVENGCTLVNVNA